EFVRLPDAQLEVAQVLGLSRGQWFSVVMVMIGVYFLLRLRRSGAEKLGGWAGARGEKSSAPATE
ncbi:hypothetical protein MNBD_PLANCTO03-2069, partial [hydrothermal vent metagenome]